PNNDNPEQGPADQYNNPEQGEQGNEDVDQDQQQSEQPEDQNEPAPEPEQEQPQQQQPEQPAPQQEAPEQAPAEYLAVQRLRVLSVSAVAKPVHQRCQNNERSASEIPPRIAGQRDHEPQRYRADGDTGIQG